MSLRPREKPDGPVETLRRLGWYAAGLGTASVVVWHRMTLPRLDVTGGEADEYPGVLSDPTDVGVRVTTFRVASPVPLKVVGTRYTLRFADGTASVLDGGSHAEAKAALVSAGIEDTTFSMTWWQPGGVAAPGVAHTAFALSFPVVRRVAVLDAFFDLRDPIGRRLTKRIPAVPQGQALPRAITAAERGGSQRSPE